jgi:hypothetical protein
MPFNLDYDRLIQLDAEDLAEMGIREAYERLLSELRKFVPQPAQVGEVIDNDIPSYSVRDGMKEYAIYGPALEGGMAHSWGRATVAFFQNVNDQLGGSGYRFYAIKCLAKPFPAADRPRDQRPPRACVRRLQFM